MEAISKDMEAVDRIREKCLEGLEAIKAKQITANDTAENNLRASAITSDFSWNETGYITPLGKQLDFSGKKFGGQAGYRSMDHREVIDYMDESATEDMNGTDAMVDLWQQEI